MATGYPVLEKDPIDIDIYQDAQSHDESEQESKYLEWLYKKQEEDLDKWPSDFDPGEQYDSDRSPKGPW